jgi:2-isopropylmalate synthase
MTPESVGARGTRLVLGKHSGRNALRRHLAALGFELDDGAFVTVFERFKALCDRDKTIDERELAALAMLAGATAAPTPAARARA